MNQANETSRPNSHYRLVGPSAMPITAHLTQVFQIGPGADLVLALAPEAPACNQAALRYWVSRELAEIASNPAGVDKLLVTLEERLLATLQSAFPDAGGDVEVPSRIARNSALPLPRWERTIGCAVRRKNARQRSARSEFSFMTTPTVQPHATREDSE